MDINLASKSVWWSVFLERAYEKMREDHVPDAPPGAWILPGLPIKKKSKGEPRIAEAHFEVMAEPDQFGDAYLIFVNPMGFADPVGVLGHLLVEMVRLSLPPETKTGKPFQNKMKDLGFGKPWARPEIIDSRLQSYLGALAHEISGGEFPSGFYDPPPPKERKKKDPETAEESDGTFPFLCGCPREVTLKEDEVAGNPVMCGTCGAAFSREEG